MSFTGILNFFEDVVTVFPELKIPAKDSSEIDEEMERRKR